MLKVKTDLQSIQNAQINNGASENVFGCFDAHLQNQCMFVRERLENASDGPSFTWLFVIQQQNDAFLLDVCVFVGVRVCVCVCMFRVARCYF